MPSLKCCILADVALFLVGPVCHLDIGTATIAESTITQSQKLLKLWSDSGVYLNFKPPSSPQLYISVPGVLHFW